MWICTEDGVDIKLFGIALGLLFLSSDSKEVDEGGNLSSKLFGVGQLGMILPLVVV